MTMRPGRPGRPEVRRTVKPEPKPPLTFATIPRRWPGGTVACLATGASLTAQDVEYVRDKVDGVIAINDAIDLAPWADILYACDGKWWGWRQGVPSYHGTKYAMKEDARRWSTHGVQMIRRGNHQGLDTRPDGVAHGYNSGYQAIGVAFHSGAKRIILLGYDMKGVHFFGHHPDRTKAPYARCIPIFKTLVKPLAERGVDVINCTRRTALTCFPQMPLDEALRKVAA